MSPNPTSSPRAVPRHPEPPPREEAAPRRARPDAPARPFPQRAEHLFAQRLAGLNLRLAPLLAAAISAGALALAMIASGQDTSLLPPALWWVLVTAAALASAVLAWRRGRDGGASAPWSGTGAGWETALLLAAAAGLGLAGADLAAPGSARWLLTVLLAVCLVGLASIAARPLRFALVAALVLAPLAFRAAPQAPDVAVAAVVMFAVLVPVYGLVSLVLASAVRSDAEQRARLDRLEFTNEALFADRQALHTESRTDALTALANRRHLEETLRNEWSRCRRSRSPLSCVLLDVDHFKAYNDHYGHDGGDDCLRAVASLLADTSRRPGDLVARQGGEEFVLLLPETGSGGAATVAELIKRALAERDLPHAASPTAPRVTVSMGVATLVPDAERIPEELLKAADLALYEAKRSGRNCVVMADREALESARHAARGMIG